MLEIIFDILVATCSFTGLVFAIFCLSEKYRKTLNPKVRTIISCVLCAFSYFLTMIEIYLKGHLSHSVIPMIAWGLLAVINFESIEKE